MATAEYTSLLNSTYHGMDCKIDCKLLKLKEYLNPFLPKFQQIQMPFIFRKLRSNSIANGKNRK